MAWTTFADITDRWIGSGQPTDEDLVDALILDAETVILSQYPRIQERIDSEALNIDVVRMVVSRMVTRVLRNPENLSYWQQSTGPFGQGRTFGKAVDIWLTGDEKTLLSPNTRGKAFSFNMAPDMISPVRSILDYDEFDPLWKDVN
jgi:hypothetical protein